MKQHLTPHRRAAAWLFAAAALPFTPLAAQDVPTVNAPPPTVTAPPPVAAPAPPPAVSVAPPPAARPAPVATRAAPAPVERTTVRTARATPRATVRTRTTTTVRRTAPVQAAPVQAAPVQAASAPLPVTAEPEPPAAALPVNGPAAVQVGSASTVAASPRGISAIWPWLLAGAALLIAAIALVARRRRRRAEEVYYDEAVYEEPVAEAAPEPSFVREAPVAAAAPIAAEAPIADEVAVVESDAADVEALAADSEPVAGRPWLEFLMRPLRAGTSDDDAIVQFELTVGNTGSVPARDVKITTWMVAAGQGTDMERSLIERPADAAVSELDIAAGDGARVDGQVALAKTGLTAAVLPVVVADARYTLPDGSEGRTHASFAVGVPDGDELAPFPTDRSPGLSENVEARLYGEPERV